MGCLSGRNGEAWKKCPFPVYERRRRRNLREKSLLGLWTPERREDLTGGLESPVPGHSLQKRYGE